MEERMCILDEEKVCDDCGECDHCDLDSNKICDNCMKCIQNDADYAEIEIAEVVLDNEGK